MNSKQCKKLPGITAKYLNLLSPPPLLITVVIYFSLARIKFSLLYTLRYSSLFPTFQCFLWNRFSSPWRTWFSFFVCDGVLAMNTHFFSTKNYFYFLLPSALKGVSDTTSRIQSSQSFYTMWAGSRHLSYRIFFFFLAVSLPMKDRPMLPAVETQNLNHWTASEALV